MRAPIRSILAFCTLALLGCSSATYLYRPEENATAVVDGRPAALYNVPPESPRGSVRVATLGIAKLHSNRNDGDEIHAMHARMVVANNDTAPWTIDTRQQLGMIEGAGQSRPAFASSSTGEAPVVTVPPGGNATVDLYYPLPESMQHASEVPRFELVWHVVTPEREVAERTTFERLRIEAPPPDDYYADVGWWGPGVYYDPLWPGYGFYGAVVLRPEVHYHVGHAWHGERFHGGYHGAFHGGGRGGFHGGGAHGGHR